jgi:hypothetical protein
MTFTNLDPKVGGYRRETELASRKCADARVCQCETPSETLEDG